MTRRRKWRDALTVHPWADRFPMLEDTDLKDLALDIKAHGLRERVVINTTGDREQLLDGRNRLAALESLGTVVLADDGTVAAEFSRRKKMTDAEAATYIVSANLRRRHLNATQRKALARQLILDNPDVSNADVAKATRTHKRTVQAERQALEANGTVEPRRTATERARDAITADPDATNIDVAKKIGASESVVRYARRGSSNGAKAPSDDADTADTAGADGDGGDVAPVVERTPDPVGNVELERRTDELLDHVAGVLRDLTGRSVAVKADVVVAAGRGSGSQAIRRVAKAKGPS